MVCLTAAQFVCLRFLHRTLLQDQRQGSENAGAEQEGDQLQQQQQQQQEVLLPEEGGSGSTRKEDKPPLRRDSSSRTEDVRLWVLEISTSGLIDTPPTPRMHTVRRRDRTIL